MAQRAYAWCDMVVCDKARVKERRLGLAVSAVSRPEIRRISLPDLGIIPRGANGPVDNT